MQIPITVPRLGWTMEQGTFVEWLKKAGEPVKVGDPLFVLEGEKATQDVEATDSGILSIPHNGPQPGDTVLVGMTIGFVCATGSTIAHAVPACPESGIPVNKSAAEQSSPEWASHAEGPAPVVSRSAEDEPRQLPAISPRARRVAEELGVDWTQIRGTGSTGRIRESDVVQQAKSPLHEPPVAPPAGVSASEGRHSHLYSGVIDTHRRVVAERMQQSAQSTAAVTLIRSIDATRLVDLRKQFQLSSQDSPVPSYNDFLMKLAAIALTRHRYINSTWEDSRVVICDEIHIGLAVDTEAGLVAPVLRGVDRLTLKQIAVRTRELVERARTQRLSMVDLQGGTFTITNLGKWGIDAFTPLINLPQAAILGIGQISREPTVIDEQVVVRDRLTLSLTFDHRIVDGAPAARFLETLSNLIVNPAPALIE